MISPARKIAYKVLHDVSERGKYVNLALQQALRNQTLDPRDRALATEIVYGTTQRQRALDALLQEVVSRKLADLDSHVLSILRMTAYQLFYLNKVPSYAAIDDAVELCKSVRPIAKGFVNGVLRTLARDKRTLDERLTDLISNDKDFAKRMGLIHSYPTWLVNEWVKAFGEERTKAIMESCNEPANLSVRVNPMRHSREEVISSLQAQYGDAAEPSVVSPFGIRFRRGIEIDHWQAYADGDITVQDEAAMLVAPLLQPQAHTRVLDMCAGVGTKTTHVAELQNDEGTIDACDIYDHKLGLLESATSRLHLGSIHTMLTDARALTSRNLEPYDAVLLDVPCSGLGVLRHRPDIRWRRSKADIPALAALQTELLRQAAKLVRPGGIIVYATCTLLPQENEMVVESILQDESLGLHWDDIRSDLSPDLVQYVADGRQDLLITPELYGTDGFYMARLRKATEE